MKLKKLRSQLAQITDVNLETQNARRMAWLTRMGKRLDFLKSLKAQRITGKFYSQHVVKWDESNSLTEVYGWV